jgi:hypothetical protein
MKEKSVLIFVWCHLWNARVSLEGADTTSYWFLSAGGGDDGRSRVNGGQKKMKKKTAAARATINFARNLDTSYDLLKDVNRPGGRKKKKNNHSCSVCGNIDNEQISVEWEGTKKKKKVDYVLTMEQQQTGTHFS